MGAAWRTALVVPLALITLACGGAEPARQETAPPDADRPVSVINYYSDTCPEFDSFSIEPNAIGLHTPGRVTVIAKDPEGGDIFFVWSTLSGRLTGEQGPKATYHCMQLGPDVISIAAFDPQGCDRMLNIYVDCSEN